MSSESLPVLLSVHECRLFSPRDVTSAHVLVGGCATHNARLLRLSDGKCALFFNEELSLECGELSVCVVSGGPRPRLLARAVVLLSNSASLTPAWHPLSHWTSGAVAGSVQLSHRPHVSSRPLQGPTLLRGNGELIDDGSSALLSATVSTIRSLGVPLPLEPVRWRLTPDRLVLFRELADAERDAKDAEQARSSAPDSEDAPRLSLPLRGRLSFRSLNDAALLVQCACLAQRCPAHPERAVEMRLPSSGERDSLLRVAAKAARRKEREQMPPSAREPSMRAAIRFRAAFRTSSSISRGAKALLIRWRIWGPTTATMSASWRMSTKCSRAKSTA
jgi:hypothetical protein